MLVGELDEAELLARVDLEVLPSWLWWVAAIASVESSSTYTSACHAASFARSTSVAAEQLGEPLAVERPAGAGAAAGAGDLAPSEACERRARSASRSAGKA